MGVYKCPVCEGRGQVPAGFYYTYQPATVVNTCPETCKSCSGKGVIFDTDCFYPYTNTPLPDDYKSDFNTICSSNSCSNCGHNDGMVYTSNPVKYKCTLTNEWHTADYRCDKWCAQCLKLFTSKEISDYISLTNSNITGSITGTEDGTVEFVNGTNTTEQTAD